MQRILCLIITCAGLSLAGCSEPSPSPPAPSPAALSGLPLEITIRQRSTAPVPENDGQLLITLDDVTRGQVIVSVATADGQPLLAPRSMQPNTSANLVFNDQPLRLTLNELDNSLTGDDYASFTLAEDNGRLTETQKIERLIQLIAGMPDAVFIRNGSEHTADKAASHLRRKWDAADDRVTTADQFIEHIASRSSMTGKPYTIRTADGQATPSAKFLTQALQRIEANG